ncbi:MAG: phosphoribosylamine--glycine ligase [Saprospiraceae bacterium]|nr:phosphoribosylamine--glycine ligase [Saprospiraceae bacterium]
MNVLLLGSGGREHALAWKMAQSKKLSQLFIAPGNAGTTSLGTNVPIDSGNFKAVGDFITEHQIQLVVIGPEAPLVNGLVDYLDRHFPQLPVVGPKASGAQLEGSKAFSKAFMHRHNIPTAAYREFNQDQVEEGLSYIDQLDLPVVLKADGLAAGKGVLICSDHEQAKKEFREMLAGKFGDASQRVVIEEFLDGIEFSVFVLTDGKEYKILPEAKDYKRIGEGDTGLNTGGMGSISPVPFVNRTLMKEVEDTIIRPTVNGIFEDGLEYRGFIFFGLIKVQDRPMVIEYNCRMGDPETQSVMPRLQNDLIDLLLATTRGTLDQIEISVDPRIVASIVMVSGGYPGDYEKGKVITGIDEYDDGVIFHAGTAVNGDKIVTSGGRVLSVTSFGNNMDEAVAKSRRKAREINFEGAYYRKDIGFDLRS